MKCCPVDATHEVVTQKPSATLEFDYCRVCREDVEYLGQKNNQQWDDAVKAWTGAGQKVSVAPAAKAYEDEEDLTGAPTLPAGRQPQTQMQPHAPAAGRVIPQHGAMPDVGTGTHRIVMESSDDIEGHIVMNLIRDVFGYSEQEAIAVVMNCHHMGTVHVKRGSLADLQALMNQVRTRKQDVATNGAAQGNPHAATVMNLRLRIEAN